MPARRSRALRRAPLPTLALAACAACAGPRSPDDVPRNPAPPPPVSAGAGEEPAWDEALAAAGEPTEAADTAGTPPPPVDERWRVAPAESGNLAVRWRPVGDGAVPRNEPFALDVQLFREGQPLSGAVLRVRGWMPDHGHGLVRQPTVTELGDGNYRVDNLLLHMRGLWQLVFDVGEGAERQNVVFELEL